MKLHNIALALAVATGGLVAGSAFADDLTVMHPSRDGGTVTKHISADPDGTVRKTTRVEHADGSTTVRRAVRTTNPDGSTTVRRVVRHKTTTVAPVKKTVVIHNATPQRHVVVRTGPGRPDRIVNRRVTVIHDNG